MKRSAYILMVLLGLSGCATQKVFTPVVSPAVQQQDQPFNLAGRISVRVDNKIDMGGFEWQHQPPLDHILIKSPIGSTVAELTRDSMGVRLDVNGQIHEAEDVETLTQSVLGWALPLSNLIWWVRGEPAPNAPYTISKDGMLEQQGWQIRFTQAEPDDNKLASAKSYPHRIDLSRANLAIRIVAQSWQP